MLHCFRCRSGSCSLLSSAANAQVSGSSLDRRRSEAVISRRESLGIKVSAKGLTASFSRPDRRIRLQLIVLAERLRMTDDMIRPREREANAIEERHENKSV